uniref:Capsid protein n=1 Tax=unidentified TaxID=32644 RepID=A0A6G9W298_9ZZZZ|nr:capsid protein [unidentified]
MQRGPHSQKKNYQIMRPYFNVTAAGQNGYQTVISPATVTGVRKVKNFSIEFSSPSQGIVVWALVYVPSGYSPNALTLTGDDVTTLYQPTNNVIMAGMYDPQDPGNTARRFTRLSRLLKAGDGLALVYSSQSDPPNFRVVLTYAIAL